MSLNKHKENHNPNFEDFQESKLLEVVSFEARLYVKDIEATDALESLLKDYNLEFVVDESQPGFRFLRVKSREVGSYKKNTLSLFVAAIELTEKHTESQLLLMHFNCLKDQILTRLEGGAVLDHHTKEILNDWEKADRGLTMTVAPVLCLNQVGFNIAIRSDFEFCSFTNNQIHEFKQKLHDVFLKADQNNADKKFRKAG